MAVNKKGEQIYRGRKTSNKGRNKNGQVIDWATETRLAIDRAKKRYKYLKKQGFSVGSEWDDIGKLNLGGRNSYNKKTGKLSSQRMVNYARAMEFLNREDVSRVSTRRRLQDEIVKKLRNTKGDRITKGQNRREDVKKFIDELISMNLLNANNGDEYYQLMRATHELQSGHPFKYERRNADGTINIISDFDELTLSEIAEIIADWNNKQITPNQQLSNEGFITID